MSMNTARSTGLLAVGTTPIVNGRNLLDSVTVITDGTNAATVTVYDNIAGSGKVLLVVAVPGAELSRTVTLDRALVAEIGLTAVVAGTGATSIVGFGAS